MRQDPQIEEKNKIHWISLLEYSFPKDLSEAEKVIIRNNVELILTEIAEEARKIGSGLTF